VEEGTDKEEGDEEAEEGADVEEETDEEEGTDVEKDVFCGGDDMTCTFPLNWILVGNTFFG